MPRRWRGKSSRSPAAATRSLKRINAVEATTGVPENEIAGIDSNSDNDIGNNDEKNQDAARKDPGELSVPSEQRSPSRAPQYGVGCNVWFNRKSSAPSSKRFDADRGVVRAMLPPDDEAQRISYEVEQMSGNKKLHRAKNIIVREEELAFAVQSPVYVRDDDGKAEETAGQVISASLVGAGENNRKDATYIMMLATEDHRVRVEEDVPAARIRYRCPLGLLRSTIKEVTPSSPDQRGFAIRTDDRGRPYRNWVRPAVGPKRRRPAAAGSAKRLKGSGGGVDFATRADYAVAVRPAGAEVGAAEISSGSGGDGPPRSDAGQEPANAEESSASASVEAEAALPEGSRGAVPLREDASEGGVGNGGANADGGGANPCVASIQEKGEGRRTIPYRGICWRGGRCMARIGFNGKQPSLGYFKLAADAALAYDIGLRRRNTGDRECKFNFSSREKYAAAVQREVERTGHPSVNAEESYVRVLAVAEAKAARIFGEGSRTRDSSLSGSESAPPPRTAGAGQRRPDGERPRTIPKENRAAALARPEGGGGPSREGCAEPAGGGRHTGIRKKKGRYESWIRHERRDHYMGRFRFSAEAALAFDVGSMRLRGTDRGFNFRSKEEYVAAIQREVERTGRPIVNAEESYAAVLATAEAKAEKISSKGSGGVDWLNRGGSSPMSTERIQVGRGGNDKEDDGPGEGGADPSASSLRKDCKVSCYAGVSKKPWGYESRVCHKCRRHSIGHFKFEADAALAYDFGWRELRGTGCGPNFLSREEYTTARRREADRTGRKLANAEEAYEAVSARVRAKLAKGLSNG